MNHVWTSIALQGSCITRQSQRATWAALSTVVRRQCSRQSQLTFSKQNSIRQKREAAWKSLQWQSALRPFSASAALSKSGRKNNREDLSNGPRNQASASPLPSSKLQPPSTTASHVEGRLEEDEPLTWRDFDPVGGMPLPQGEVSQRMADNIFGTTEAELDVDTANYILSILYYRRISGSLIDYGIGFPKQSDVREEWAVKGIEYVRSLDPDFDENAAGIQWADEEEQRLQGQLIERAERLGIYKREPEEEEMIPEEEQQGTAYGRAKTAESGLLALRKANEAKWEEEQAEKQVAAERAAIAEVAASRGPLQLEGGVQPPNSLTAYGQGGSIGRPQTKAWLAPVERKPWVKYYEEHAQIIRDNAVPQMSTFARLAPAFIFTLAVFALAAFLSDNYTPPPKSARMFPDTPPAVATLGALTAVLAISFVGSRFPPLWRTYSKFFTLVPAYPYAISLLGATLRHDPVHLISNVVGLWVFGLLLHEDVGRGTFLAIYLSSGALGGLASLSYNVLTRSWMTYIYGSSGAVLGVMSAACALHPTGKVKVLGYEFPIAIWVFVALYGALEVSALVRRGKTTIDHAGHVGGMLSGLSSAYYLRQRAKSRTTIETDLAVKGAAPA